MYRGQSGRPTKYDWTSIDNYVLSLDKPCRIRDIVHKFGICENTVFVHYKRKGWLDRFDNTNRRIRKYNWEKIISEIYDYENDISTLTCGEIMDKYGILNRQNIIYQFKIRSLKLKRAPRRFKHDWEKVEEYIRSVNGDTTVKKLSKKFNISTSTLFRRSLNYPESEIGKIVKRRSKWYY